jgi:hypothetical protein
MPARLLMVGPSLADVLGRANFDFLHADLYFVGKALQTLSAGIEQGPRETLFASSCLQAMMCAVYDFRIS